MQGHTPMPPAVSPLRKQLDTLHLHIEGLIKIKLELEKLHAEETQPVVLTADSHVVSASPLEPRDEAAPVPLPELRLTRRQWRAATTRRPRARLRVDASQEPSIEPEEEDHLRDDSVPTSRSRRLDIAQERATEFEQKSGLHVGSMSTSRGQDDAASVPQLDGTRVTRTPGVVRRSLVRFPSSRVGRDATPRTSQEPAIEPEEEDNLDDGSGIPSRARAPNIPPEPAVEPDQDDDLEPRPALNTPATDTVTHCRHCSSTNPLGQTACQWCGGALTNEANHMRRVAARQRRVAERQAREGANGEPDDSTANRSSSSNSSLDASNDREFIAPNVVYHCPNCFGSNPMTNISCDKCGAALSLAATNEEVRRGAEKYWALKNARSAKHSAQRTQPSFEGLFEQELSRRNTAAASGFVVEGDETRDG